MKVIHDSHAWKSMTFHDRHIATVSHFLLVFILLRFLKSPIHKKFVHNWINLMKVVGSDLQYNITRQQQEVINELPVTNYFNLYFIKVKVFLPGWNMKHRLCRMVKLGQYKIERVKSALIVICILVIILQVLHERRRMQDYDILSKMNLGNI